MTIGQPPGEGAAIAGGAAAPERHGGAYWFVLSALFSLVATGSLFLALRWPRPGAILIETPRPGGVVPVATVPVYISGAVARPGVYWLAEGSVVVDVLELAGGPRDDADLERVNLAARVGDGSHVHVPRHGEAATQGSSGAPGQVLIDINAASAAELESLPGIGPALAGRIVAYREEHGAFSTVEELMNVSGIGERTFESLREMVVVR